jgi:hypothetical protein
MSLAKEKLKRKKMQACPNKERITEFLKYAFVIPDQSQY